MAVVDDCKDAEHPLEHVLDVVLLKIRGKGFAFVDGENGSVVDLGLDPAKYIVYVLRRAHLDAVFRVLIWKGKRGDLRLLLGIRPAVFKPNGETLALLCVGLVL